MASVPITELKAHLAKYLRLARRGVEVQVLDRGVPIARLVSMAKDAKVAEPALLERLVSAGLVRQGAGGVRRLRKQRLEVSAGFGAAVEDDRRDRG